MKKILLISILIMSIVKVVSAQTVTVTGIVNDPSGNPLHFAFVQDKQYKYAAYTDSLGNFTLTVNPTSKLRVNCYGFKDTLLNIANQTSFHIVLYPIPNFTAANSGTSGNNVNRFANEAGLTSTGQRTLATTQGSMIPQFTIKEQTQGSRYLFTAWVHGYVISAADSLIQNSKFWFNYDKMGGGLLLSQDKNSAIEVNKEQVKGFTLFNSINQPFIFENVVAIDPNHYTQVLATGKDYKIYKSIKTKFVKADYSSNGITSTGNNYDEYVNTGTYYIFNVKTNQLQKIDLKKKSIKNAFTADADKVNKFTVEHSSDDINDSYLSNLGSYMNE